MKIKFLNIQINYYILFLFFILIISQSCIKYLNYTKIF